MLGGSHSDVLNGGAGDDLLSGGAGDDVITGGAGDDLMTGGSGDDIMLGGAGDDLILGGSGDDILQGGAGDDLMIGGSGSDTFVFTGGGGNDVVLDFTLGEDMLSISKGINGTGIESADDVASHATQVGANTVIDLGNGDSITLNNVDAEDVQDNPDSFFSVQ